MKTIYLYVFFFLLLADACQHASVTSRRTQQIGRIPLVTGSFKIHLLDSTHILYPQGIHYFNGHLIFIEPKNDPILSFWNADSLTYEFSAGRKGAGPDEMKFVSRDYFDRTDSTFFLLDSDVEKEIVLTGGSISVKKRVPILIPDAVNRLVRVDTDRYVMCGRGQGDKEHILYRTDGEYTEFGEYPDYPCPPDRRFMLFYKFIAYRPGQPALYDFYLYLNLIRKYDLSGNLLEEITLKDIPERNNKIEMLKEGRIRPCFRDVLSFENFIAVLFYENFTNSQVYDRQVSPELQLWNWSGELVRRYRFDRCFDQYTISDDGILYAKDTATPYTVYTYDLRLENVR